MQVHEQAMILVICRTLHMSDIGIVSGDFDCTTAMMFPRAAEVAPCCWEKFCCGAINTVRQCSQTVFGKMPKARHSEQQQPQL